MILLQNYIYNTTIKTQLPGEHFQREAAAVRPHFRRRGIPAHEQAHALGNPLPGDPGVQGPRVRHRDVEQQVPVVWGEVGGGVLGGDAVHD